MNDDNIYSAPEANLEVTEELELVLASRWSRFWSAILDSLILAIVFVPAMYFFSIWDPLITDQRSTVSDILLSALVLVIYIVLNIYLLTTSGQTIAKKMLNIRVVDFETEKLLPFWKIVGVRYIPFYSQPGTFFRTNHWSYRFTFHFQKMTIAACMTCWQTLKLSKYNPTSHKQKNRQIAVFFY